ncbi:hypothetical protein IID21_03905 [Patescibacteria group bacterium]|nr:hypothetical protein [Patescibacteria group bacterium]
MEKKKFFISFFEDFGLLFLSVVLFIGGIFILSAKIAFWSLFLGIASIQIGIVLIILTFDSFIKRKSGRLTDEYKTLNCLVCRAPTFVPKYQATTICHDCQLRISKTFKTATLVVFALVTLTATVGLVSQNQDLRRQAAQRPILVCDQGVWEPEVCQCGVWEAAGPEGLRPGGSVCEKGVPSRLCSDGKTYCCEREGDSWDCYQVE